MEITKHFTIGSSVDFVHFLLYRMKVNLDDSIYLTKSKFLIINCFFNLDKYFSNNLGNNLRWLPKSASFTIIDEYLYSSVQIFKLLSAKKTL